MIYATPGMVATLCPLHVSRTGKGNIQSLGERPIASSFVLMPWKLVFLVVPQALAMCRPVVSVATITLVAATAAL